MKKNPFLLPVILFSILISAQKKIPFISYEEINKKVVESADRGDYEKTLEYLNTINKNDSAYSSVMLSKSYYLMTLKRYDEALTLIDKGLNAKYYDLYSSFYINKVVALLHQKKHREAIKISDEGLQLFPMNRTLLYNKGVSLERMGDIEGAVAAYQKTIFVDPSYKNPYLQLGNICYKQELISKALMCFNMYLLLEPNADNAFNILKLLNNIVQGKNENSKNSAIKISADDESFDEVDLIINNKVALNEKYNTGNDINIALTRQNHALLQSLKNFSGNGGFWDRKFVPYYQWVINNNHFNAFVYTLSYSIENETYKKIINKKEKEISNFFDLSKQKWIEIIQNNIVKQKGEKENLTYFYSGGYLRGIGKMDGNLSQGPWEFFNNEGRLTGKGKFSLDGNREGDWVWYNSQGKIQETAKYINGKLNGSNLHYYNNGKQKIIASYKNDELDGEYKYYNEKGALQQKKFFKGGELDGLFQSYHDVGEELLKSNVRYYSGKVKEKYNEYFPIGTISSEINFNDGKTHGQETQNYLNGKQYLDINSKNGLIDGYYKKFYSNGNPMVVGQTLEGKYVGNWQNFYSNNILESDFIYNDNGELDGEYKYYDIDGKLNYIFEYRRDEFIAYKYFNKDGKIIDENRKKGGEFYYKGYSPYGKIVSEGLYDIKGGKKGKWRYFSSNGILTAEGEYKNNKAQGEHKTYYTNGELESISPYKNDTLNGYYVNYHKNGKIKRQGWYMDDNLHGEWRSYTPDGNVSEINFYHKGFLHGEQLVFSGKGLKTRSSLYEYGGEIRDTYYNVDGNVNYSIEYKNIKESYELLSQHSNKKASAKQIYVNGVKHGAYSFFNFYGRKRITGNYLNGKLQEDLIWYFDDGSVETKAKYIYGELEGDYINYFKNGNINSKYYYTLGKLQKNGIKYYDNGNIKSKSKYYDDKLQGRRESYSPTGKLQLVRFYNYGRLMGYSYLDENSAELPMIPIDNETGKILAYYDNGKVSREMHYRYGYLDSSYKEYYYSGQLLGEMYYAKEELDGKKTEYFSNGSLKSEQVYQLGKLNGVAKEYFENGQIKKVETYLHDIKEGITKKYDKSGKLIIEETYFNDDIISSTSK